MEGEVEGSVHEGHRRRRRSTKPFYRRRRFWITLLSILVGSALTVWLIRTFENYRPPDSF